MSLLKNCCCEDSEFQSIRISLAVARLLYSFPDQAIMCEQSSSRFSGNTTLAPQCICRVVMQIKRSFGPASFGHKQLM
jgi:hypothetical protein